MTTHDTNRREFLAASLLLASGLFTRAQAVESASSTRRGVLTPSQKDLLRVLCETIIPKTDTPGATEAGVSEFIELILANWCNSQERDAFVKGLNALGDAALARHEVDFSQLTVAQRLAFLQPLDQQAAQARAAGEDPLPFFATLKELTLIGYYTSQVGCEAIGYPGPMGTGPGPNGPIDSDIWV